jgi:hypothetical protein
MTKAAKRVWSEGRRQEAPSNAPFQADHSAAHSARHDPQGAGQMVFVPQKHIWLSFTNQTIPPDHP